MTTIAMGNCPSSGSTYFADLLDSSVFSAVGPELNLFSLEQLYDSSQFTDFYTKKSKFSSVYLRRNGLVLNDLCSYGLDVKRLKAMLEESRNLSDFLRKFSQSFLALRGKDINGVVFEKSPQNINCIRQYLEYSDNYFVHIVRNPMNVYKSLINRGFSPFISMVTWLLDEAKMYNFLDNDRVIVIKYEELINSPYRIASDVISKVSGFDVDPLELERAYKNNNFRKLHTVKLNSWSNIKTGRDSLKRFTEFDLGLLQYFRRTKVNPTYARFFDLAEVSFEDLLFKLGYESDFTELVETNSTSGFEITSTDKYRLFRKFSGDFKSGDARFWDLNIYMNPVDKI